MSYLLLAEGAEQINNQAGNYLPSWIQVAIAIWPIFAGLGIPAAIAYFARVLSTRFEARNLQTMINGQKEILKGLKDNNLPNYSAVSFSLSYATYYYQLDRFAKQITKRKRHIFLVFPLAIFFGLLCLLFGILNIALIILYSTGFKTATLSNDSQYLTTFMTLLLATSVCGALSFLIWQIPEGRKNEFIKGIFNSSSDEQIKILIDQAMQRKDFSRDLKDINKLPRDIIEKPGK